MPRPALVLVLLVSATSCAGEEPDKADADAAADNESDLGQGTGDVAAEDGATNDAWQDATDAGELAIDAGAPDVPVPPSCAGAATVGKPCSPAKDCFPGFVGKCTCEGCKCYPRKPPKQTCPGGPGCECAEHWSCDIGLCVPRKPLWKAPASGGICASLCVDSCQEGFACHKFEDACGEKKQVCLPDSVTPGDVPSSW